jgi:hypothetical protein
MSVKLRSLFLTSNIVFLFITLFLLGNAGGSDSSRLRIVVSKLTDSQIPVISPADRLEIQIVFNSANLAHFPPSSRRAVKENGSIIVWPALEIKAENQDPEYFSKRPGPNVILKCFQIKGSQTLNVPIRIYTHGGGGESLSLSIDVLASQETRKAKINEYLRMIDEKLQTRPKSERNASDLQDSNLISYFESSLISNPPGSYQLQATYTEPEAFEEPIVSEPFSFEVSKGKDSMDLLKEKLLQKEKH